MRRSEHGCQHAFREKVPTDEAATAHAKLRAAFARAEQDGTAPLAVMVGRPRVLTGGAVERVRKLVEA